MRQLDAKPGKLPPAGLYLIHEWVLDVFSLENLLESSKSILLPEIEEEKYPKSGPGVNEYQRIPTLLTTLSLSARSLAKSHN